MLATKILPFAPPERGEPDLKTTLAAVLDLENGQVTRSSPAPGSNHRPEGLAGSSWAPLKNEPADVRLAIPKSRSLAPSAAILQRHRLHKSSLEEVMLELYHGNISVAQADEAARVLWGEGADAALISELAPAITKRIQSWLTRAISEPQRYVFLHALDVKQKIGGENRLTNLFAAIGIRSEGSREGLGVLSATGQEGWPQLIAGLKQRGLRGTALFIGENDPAAAAAVRAHFPAARYQGNLIRLEREVLLRIRPAEMISVMNAFEAMRASTTPKEAAAKLAALAARLARYGAPDAAAALTSAAGFQFSYYHFPRSHWPRLHDIEPMRRILHGFREWIRVIGPVADDRVVTLMAAARLRSTARLLWARRRYINP